MDDIQQAFGAAAPKTPVEEAWHNEQRRKQYDIIRVKNPTNQDFYVMYDVNQYQKIPANSTLDVPRYIAIRYVQHQKDNIINAMIKKKHDDHMAERAAKGMPNFKSKWEENEETYSSADYPKTNDPELMAQIMDELWVGLVHEFGRDVPPQAFDPRAGEVDLTPPEMKILEGLDKRRVTTTEAPVQQYGSAPISTPPPMIPQEPQVPQYGFSAMSEALSGDEITQNE